MFPVLGVCAGDRPGAQVRPKALVSDCKAPARENWKTVPRALAQPPEPRGEEVVLDARGRSDHL